MKNDIYHGESPCLTRKNAAKFLDVSLRTVDRLCRDKGLPKYKIGRSSFFKLSDIIEWRDKFLIRTEATSEN